MTTSVVGGDGTLCFHRPGAAKNVITICPRLRDGIRAAYIHLNDVQAVVSVSNHKLMRTQLQSDIDSDGNIVLLYTLDDDDCVHFTSTTKLQVCVRVCGVLLVNVRVHAATFDGRTARHVLNRNLLMDIEYHMAIHPAGTRLVVSSFQDVLKVFGLPDMNLLATLGSRGDGPNNLKFPRGLCFTDAGTLLVTDYINCRVQHWSLEGSYIASYATFKWPLCVASRGNLFVVGDTVRSYVCSLENGDVLHTWPAGITINEVVFVDANVLAAASHLLQTVCLYALNGGLLRQLTANIISTGLAVCADGCLLMSNYYRKTIHVFAPNGTEVTTAPLATHTFQSPRTIALCGEYAFVLEVVLNSTRISVLR